MLRVCTHDGRLICLETAIISACFGTDIRQLHQDLQLGSAKQFHEPGPHYFMAHTRAGMLFILYIYSCTSWPRESHKYTTLVVRYHAQGMCCFCQRMARNAPAEAAKHTNPCSVSLTDFWLWHMTRLGLQQLVLGYRGLGALGSILEVP